MSKENKLVPEIRFPSFRSSEDWSKIQLIDVTNKNEKWSFIGGPFGSNLKSSDYVQSSDGVRIIQLQNIGDGEFHNDYKIYTSVKKADELLSCNIYPGDIIMSKMGDPVGRACIIPSNHDRYVMCSDGIRVVVDENKYDKYFVYLVINSKSFRELVEKTATGSTRKRIGLSDLKKLHLYVPKEKKEQQKIADCLSSLDDLIGAESDKLDQLKDHKKGLLQQLFPAEGETVPKLRFPQFENDGEWEEKEVGEIFDVTRGYVLSMNLVTKDKTEESPYPVYSSQTKDNGLAGYYNEYLYEDAITWTTDGANAGDVNYRKGKFYCTNVCGVLLNSNGLANKCIAEIINSVSKKHVSYVGNPKLMNGVMSKIKIAIPSIEEQNKISLFLESADLSIRIQLEKLDALKDHKKGLMQQLFPNLNNLSV
jgi:type I restriction enzyme S subunit